MGVWALGICVGLNHDDSLGDVGMEKAEEEFSTGLDEDPTDIDTDTAAKLSAMTLNTVKLRDIDAVEQEGRPRKRLVRRENVYGMPLSGRPLTRALKKMTVEEVNRLGVFEVTVFVNE
ncbi:hypothetical protein VNI00_017632 [Paramarasmius palmivorus]|uniref:Uncharacterized protein n=1 Tax=Paramarasmius palmivorus TaxID=297713 RepID=A0AAW0B3V0_9AGAR